MPGAGCQISAIGAIEVVELVVTCGAVVELVVTGGVVVELAVLRYVVVDVVITGTAAVDVVVGEAVVVAVVSSGSSDSQPAKKTAVKDTSSRILVTVKFFSCSIRLVLQD